MKVRDVSIHRDRLTIIAGPCLAESYEICKEVGASVKELCHEFGFNYIFKASFDKANRTSAGTERGMGLSEGLKLIRTVANELGTPCTTDVHESHQAAEVADAVDLLQIPAFLCRQTDLLHACARTGKPINVKKGQFLAPWDAKNIVDKLRSFEAHGIMLTERGTSFGYNSLVVDFPGLEVMHSFGVPVCFDATHSAQRPGAAGGASGGNREAIPALVRAAVAVGIDALFMEIHPDPENAQSDSATQWPLARAREMFEQIARLTG